MSGSWQIGEARSRAPASRALLSGWELSGILAAQSGLPYSALVSFDLNNDGNTNNDRVPGLGRNTFYLPGSISLDPRVTKNLPISENVRLQLIGEAFNVLNHGNVIAARTTQFARSSDAAACGIARTPCLVPQNSGLNAFGVPTTSSGPRIVQLSARLIF